MVTELIVLQLRRRRNRARHDHIRISLPSYYLWFLSGKRSRLCSRLALVTCGPCVHPKQIQAWLGGLALGVVIF